MHIIVSQWVPAASVSEFSESSFQLQILQKDERIIGETSASINKYFTFVHCRIIILALSIHFENTGVKPWLQLELRQVLNADCSVLF